MKPLLIHAQPMDKATGIRVDVRVGSVPSPVYSGLGGFRWESAVSRRPRLMLDLMSAKLDGKLQTGRGDFMLNLSQIRDVAEPWSLQWSGAPVTIYDATGLNYGSMPVEFTGIVANASLDIWTKQLILNLEVERGKLIRPLLTLEFDGSGGAGGDAEKRGTLKPAGFGYVENVEPVWFDEVNNVGMLDGYGNVTTVHGLFEGLDDRGASVGNYATYGALVVATIPPGRWATCTAQGMVRLGAPPAQGLRISCDVTFRGAAGNGANRPGALLRRILETHAGLGVAELDTASFAALDAAVPRNVHYWTKDQREVLDLIEAISASCNASTLILLNGLIAVTRAFGGANIGTLNRTGTSTPAVTDWQIAAEEEPLWRMRARSCRPGAVFSYEEVLYEDDLEDKGAYNAGTTYRQGNLVWMPNGSQWLYTNATPAAGNAPPAAGTSNAWWQQTRAPTTAADLVYADGTPIENLKPATAGATKNLVFVQPTAPPAPAEFTLWVDTSSVPNIYKMRLGGVWHTAASLGVDLDTLLFMSGAAVPKQQLMNQEILLNADGTASFWNGTSWVNLGSVTLNAITGTISLTDTRISNKSLANLDAAAAAQLTTLVNGAAAAADDGVIAIDEKKRTIDAIDLLLAQDAVLEGRRQELSLATTVRNLIAYTRINTANWSGPPVQNGTTTAYDGSDMEWWQLDDKFLTIASNDALVVGASYTVSFKIKHNQAGKKHSIGIRRVGGAAVYDATNYSVIELTDEYQEFTMPQAALGSAQTAIMFDGRTTGLGTLGLPALPAGFSIAVDDLQLEAGLSPSPPQRQNGAVTNVNYLTTARAEFLAALAMIFPRLRDMGTDSFIIPADNELPNSTLSGWTLTGATRTVVGDGFYRIEDNSGSAMEYLERSVTTPAQIVTLVAVVDKDATGRAARFPRFAMRAASDHINLDTSTGESNADAGGTSQVINGGNVWVAVRSKLQSAGAQDVRAYPSRGASAAWADNVAATGTVDVRSLTVFFGDFTAARRRGSFRRRLENFHKALERLRKAVSNVDGITGLVVSPQPDTIIDADHQGNVLANELPIDIGFKATLGLQDVTSLCAWTRTFPAGVTTSMGAATGLLNITTPMTASDVTGEIQANYLGFTRKVPHRIRKVNANPPTGGTGGGATGSASDSTLASVTGTGGTVVSDVLEVSAASATATLSADIAVSTARTAPEATYRLEGKWQWNNAGTWTDIGSYVDTSPHCSVVDLSAGEAGIPPYYRVNDGQLTVNTTKGTLTVGTAYQFRFVVRHDATSDNTARSMTLTGTVSVAT